MRKLVYILLTLLLRSIILMMLVTHLCPVCKAFDIKRGDYYFDNSKLHFSTVKMVLGTDIGVTVFQLVPHNEMDWWTVTLPEDIEGLKGFSFIDSEVLPGTYSDAISPFLDSLQRVEPGGRMTKIRDGISCESEEIVGWVFCPLDDNTISDGYWRPQDSYNLSPTGTLPIIYITTQDSATVSSKEYYINGRFWLDNCGIEEFSPMGDESNQLDIEIKGRGNYTWRTSYKKPYKIKFLHKQSPLGLDKSRHFVLKPDYNDATGYLRNETGFEVSRQLGMPYTPRQYPVELVLNGEYQGLYFLCEKIRVESGRVDIMEQQDLDDNPDNATGGWLLETGIDRNVVIRQFQNRDTTNSWFEIMSQSPEILSSVQKDYIHDFLFRVDSCIYVVDKNDRGWESLVDINSLARFYIIHEVMDNVEAFSGSLFMYKDYGWEEKLRFGPVWDFDNSFTFYVSCDNFLYNYEPAHFSFLWIKEATKFPRFQREVNSVWKEFVDNNTLEKLMEHATLWRSQIVEAEQQDARRWRTYASSYAGYYVNYYLSLIDRKISWLNQQWGNDSDIIPLTIDDKIAKTVKYYNIAGVEKAEPFKGVNIKVTTYTDGSRSSEKIIR